MPTIDTVLLDRDGAIIADEHYLSDPDRVRLLPGAGRALSRMAAAGIRLFVVSNQSGIGRGMFGEGDLLAVHERLEALLSDHGVCLSGAAYCPHHPDAGCACRKPGIGHWESLRDRHGLDAARTAVIGDKASDVAFGKNLGAALTVMVLTGHGRTEAARLRLPPLDGPFLDMSGAAAETSWPDVLARDLSAAVDRMLAGPQHAEATPRDAGQSGIALGEKT